MRQCVAMLCLLGLLGLTGCGTFVNMFQLKGLPECKVYGGTRSNLRGFADWHKLDAKWRTHLLIDLPLCVVADTATLPITIPMRLSGHRGTSETTPGLITVPADPPADDTGQSASPASQTRSLRRTGLPATTGGL